MRYRLYVVRKVVGCTPLMHPFASWFRYHCDSHSMVTTTKTLHCAPVRRQAHNCQYTLPILSLCYITPQRRWALVMFSVRQSREHSVPKNTTRSCLMYCTCQVHVSHWQWRALYWTNELCCCWHRTKHMYVHRTHKLFIFVCIPTVRLRH